MKSKHFLTIASLSAAISLTGCGEKKTETTTPPNAPATPAPAPAPAAPAAPAPAPAAPAPAAATAAATNEKAAFENFKKEAGEVAKWAEAKMKEAQAGAAGNPLGSMTAMGEVFDKLRAIKTDGLPADFKGAWGEMGDVFGEMSTIVKGIKIEKPEDALKVMTELGPKMQAVQAKIEPVSKKFEEIAKKYGIDMNTIMPKQ
jgi:hypothetical protein